ncbi:MAG: hypothetical protein KDA78_10105 [Planctomycetaceae bacterium]|nr:hypothetical protein [Planctomycetaceae bacterium]
MPASIELKAADHPWDNGDSIDVTLSGFDPEWLKKLMEGEISGVISLGISEEQNGLFPVIASVPPNDGTWSVSEDSKSLEMNLSGLKRDEKYFLRAFWTVPDAEPQLMASITESISPERQWFIGDKFELLFVGLVICGSVVLFIEIARRGKPLKVRKIAGLEAVDEAVGRATEMGRTILFIPGIQDMNDIQTIAGLNILSQVAQTAAEYEADVEVPTDRSLVMTAARETLQNAYLSAGKPDAYNPDLAYYVTDEQFGFVAYVSGHMVREKPAACFYLGAFYAESLILAETGNSIGAIQVAGTAEPSQLPFFVAACDYTLIGEELFAASAYLSGSPEEMGSLKGQDAGKILVGAGVLAGCLAETMAWSFMASLGVLTAVIGIPAVTYHLLKAKRPEAVT